MVLWVDVQLVKTCIINQLKQYITYKKQIMALKYFNNLLQQFTGLLYLIYKNTNILQDVNIEENWLIKSTMSQKPKYFGHVKCPSNLERTLMEGMVLGKSGSVRPAWRWT